MSGPTTFNPTARFRAMFHEWRTRSQSRRQLAGLSARELRDIGVSPGEAIAEASKPFWIG